MRYKKIIWAIDPLVNSTKMIAQGTEALKFFTAQMPAVVIPTYVLSPDQVSLAIEYSKPDVALYTPVIRNALEKKLKAVKADFLADAKILLQNLPSTRSAVDTLIKFARSENADFIFVQTHARKGAVRFFLGSFAETLFLYSSRFEGMNSFNSCVFI